MMREALRELYGIEGSLIEQYFTYWGRMLVLDFGPSLSAFPTPVSVLIARALPWTIGLLFTCTLIAWAARQPARRPRPATTATAARSTLLGVVAMALPPGPLLHHRLHPAADLRLPLAGAADQRRRGAEHRRRASRSTYIGSVLHALDPAGAVDHPRRHRRLVPRHAGARLQHRHRGLRHLRRARRRPASGASCRSTSCATRWCRRSPASPCRSARSSTARSSSSRCSAIPGLGRLLIGAVYSADYSLVLGVTAISIIAVAASVFLIDILYPLFDPRMQLA